MATDQEKQELVDNLKDPRYYRITINGYGGEASYMSINKEAYDFWKDHTEQYGDGDLVHYMVSAEDGDFEFEEIEGVPTEAEFMTDEDGDPRPWYEPPNELDHSFGGTYDACWITVDEVSNEEYNADHICEVIDREQVPDLVSRILEETNDEIEIIEMGCCDEHEDVDYIAQMYSSEKGCFFDGIVQTHGEFDPRKLGIRTVEYMNGEDTITEIYYDDEEVDNMGGDTNGKGYYAAVFEN